jgi:signal transduction histidine kinase
MAPQGEWLRPPRTLFIILFLLTLASISALGWLGWRLFEQERLVEGQRSQERLEQAADRISATIHGTLAETGDRLGDASAPANGVLLKITEDGLTSSKPLLFYPMPLSATADESEPSFDDAEQLEFAARDLPKALSFYRSLSASNDIRARAGALLREARVLRAMGRDHDAETVYEHLREARSVTLAGVPSDLIALHALCEMKIDCGELHDGLRQARWKLTRGQFEFYWGSRERPPAESLAIAESAERIWEDRAKNLRVRGLETLWLEGHPYVVIWRGLAEKRIALVIQPESILKSMPDGIHYALLDSEGRVVAGEKDPSAHGAVRTAGDGELPWTLLVTEAQPMTAAARIAQQRFLILSIVVMVLFLVLGTYFIARAIRRESETARMQSDFVSAVSHEFRTPLTAVRHLSELLVEGRAPSEERRKLYYATLLRESSRLERLVEGLLNFGRMEAGARHYRFEELDAAKLVERVTGEFQQQLESEGRKIELAGASAPLKIEADPEAIGVALRNLVDNAIKYSPGEPTVWVDWGLERNQVAIRVKDHGPGIPDSERKRIFRRFVRGSAAASTNAKGSGVGLAMVRHIVMAHGGEITVESSPGKGSVFTMLLPEAGTV